MSAIKLHYEIDGTDFTRAGEASASVKKTLRQLGVRPDVIRKVAIALYEGEINMVIHADGGYIDVDIDSEKVSLALCDHGKALKTLSLPCRRDIPPRPTRFARSASAPAWGFPI